MKSIKSSENDYVVMLISNDFIKSENCMFEVMEMLKVDEYKDKVLPIIIKTDSTVNDLKISNFKDREKYTDYWSHEYDNHHQRRKNTKDWLNSNL